MDPKDTIPGGDGFVLPRGPEAPDDSAISERDFIGYSQLVASLYRCLNDNSGFQPFFDAFQSHFRCLQGGILGLTLAPIRMMYGWTFGYPEGFEQWFINSDLPRQDEALKTFAALPPRHFDSLVGGDASVDILDLLTEDTRAWAAEAGLGDSAGMLVTRGRDAQIVFLANRHRSEGPYSRQEILQMNLLAPHIENAINLHHKLYHSRADNRSLSAALDLVGKPMLVFNELAQVAQLNASAREVLRDHPRLFVTDGPAPVLRSRHAGFNEELMAAIATSVFNARLNVHDTVTLVDGSGDERLALCFTPLQDDGGHGQGALAELICFSSSRDVDEDRLRALFDCTVAESRTAALLMRGLTSDQIAGAEALSIHTVRQYIKSLLSKNGYRRQAELVAALVRALG
ncbi:helix-turn-helix transcriptional regulator [Marinobacter sp. M1N3S26]|uniref:helix-turn-helix transcriptional regulator n=1 Tax=Marinobacter sp. M1N3S26 TaxID=3382299 RepID=UPI00387B4184